ncbi:hypothetical protein [Streptomyces sp. NPDC058572]|uniref:hypothetical protein n=1 Tax=Streptomyces sp. NPDC058572 TaxID=3346546 RepID=UPI00364667BC
MKIRHVRAVAVFGIVLIALTGARGSRGGGCDNDSSSSSSSSSGGSTTGGGHYDDDDDIDVTSGGGSASGGGDATQTPGAGGVTGPVDARGEVEIDFCSIDPGGSLLRGQLSIDNQSDVDQSYDIKVHFAGDGGEPVVAQLDDVTVAAYSNYTTDASAPYAGSGKPRDDRGCWIVSATRTAAAP